MHCYGEHGWNACFQKTLEPVAIEQISLKPGEYSNLFPMGRKIFPPTFKHLPQPDPWLQGVLILLADKLLNLQGLQWHVWLPVLELTGKHWILFYSLSQFCTCILWSILSNPVACTIFGQLWLQCLSVWLHYLQKGNMGLSPLYKRTDHQ